MPRGSRGSLSLERDAILHLNVNLGSGSKVEIVQVVIGLAVTSS
jgi:hypothetical protein